MGGIHKGGWRRAVGVSVGGALALACLAATATPSPAPAEASLAACNGPFATVLHAAPVADARAYWLNRQIIKWPGADSAGVFKLYYSATAQLQAKAGARVTGADGSLALSRLDGGVPADVAQRFKFVGEGALLAVPAAQSAALLKQQVMLVLETDDGQYVYETLAIMQYLEEQFPENPMWGVTEAERRRVDMQCDLINEWYHVYYLSSAHIFPYLSKSKVQAQDVNIVTSPMWRTRLEQINEVKGDSKFLAGDVPTMPDCMLFPIFEYVREVYDSFIPPHLKDMMRWYEDFKALPGIPLLDLPDWYHDELIRRHGSKI